MRRSRLTQAGPILALLAALTTVMSPGHAYADDTDLEAPPVNGDPTSAVIVDPGGGNPECGLHPSPPVQHPNSPANPNPTYWTGLAVGSCQSPIAFISVTAQLAFYYPGGNGQRIGQADTETGTWYVKAEGKAGDPGVIGTLRTWANATFNYDHVVGPLASLAKGCRRVNNYTVSCAAASSPVTVGPHLEE